ncbi:recombinase RecT [Mesorhizobium sp. CN5-321]|uniref:recombinase RecT n=1 Tax=Mesorhizobium hunchu TaxID=3157708 RepID=UPI0032B74605
MNQIATQSDSRMLAIEEKINRDVSSAITVGVGGITFQNAGEVMEYAKMMAVSGSAVPKHLRGQPGACLGIIDDAIRFRTSPYALARKSYFVNDNLAYEAQVIAGVINAFAPLKQRPDIKWTGEGPDRVCIVIAEFKDGAVREVKSPKLKDIHPKNSPLWKSDPDQQQSYYTLRSFARRWCPEIILGIYDVEEMRFAEMRDVSPEQPSVMQRLQARQEAPQTREGFDQSFVTRETAALTGEAASTQTEDNSQSSDNPSPSDEGSDGAMSPGHTVAATNSEPADAADTEEDAQASETSKADHGGQSASSSELSPDDREWLLSVAKQLWAATGIGEQELVAGIANDLRNKAPEAISQVARAKALSIVKQCKLVCFGEQEAADTLELIAGIVGVETKDIV